MYTYVEEERKETKKKVMYTKFVYVCIKTQKRGKKHPLPLRAHHVASSRVGRGGGGTRATRHALANPYLYGPGPLQLRGMLLVLSNMILLFPRKMPNASITCFLILYGIHLSQTNIRLLYTIRIY